MQNYVWEVSQDGCYLQLHSKYRLIDRATAQAVTLQLPTAVARLRSQFRSCWIWGGQIGTGRGFLPVFRFPLPIFFYQISIIIHHPGLVE
jgi:hypothetical protein